MGRGQTLYDIVIFLDGNNTGMVRSEWIFEDEESGVSNSLS